MIHSKKVEYVGLEDKSISDDSVYKWINKTFKKMYINKNTGEIHIPCDDLIGVIRELNEGANNYPEDNFTEKQKTSFRNFLMDSIDSIWDDVVTFVF